MAKEKPINYGEDLLERLRNRDPNAPRNADDITFNKDLPEGHDLTDPDKRRKDQEPEGGGSAVYRPGLGSLLGGTETGSDVAADNQATGTDLSGANSTGSGTMSYEDWSSRIHDVMNNDADYQAAKEKLAEAEGTRPDYAGTYDDDILNAYNKILNREGFEYNLDDDALYQQYADKYMAAGKLAMRNSMGQASALTGGYGSSYGQAVGQQTYDAYLQNLNDKALEMYDRAYGRYQDEGQRLKDAYSLAGDMANTEYGRYRDAMSQWNTDRGYATDEANLAWNRAYQLDSDAYNRNMQEDELAYQRQMDYANTLAAYGDFSGFADIFGEDRAAEMQKVWNAGNFDLAYNSGKITAEEYKAMTGKYPPGYKKKGGGGSGGPKDDGSDIDAMGDEYDASHSGDTTTSQPNDPYKNTPSGYDWRGIPWEYSPDNPNHK